MRSRPRTTGRPGQPTPPEQSNRPGQRTQPEQPNRPRPPGQPTQPRQSNRPRRAAQRSHPRRVGTWLTAGALATLLAMLAVLAGCSAPVTDPAPPPSGPPTASTGREPGLRIGVPLNAAELSPDQLSARLDDARDAAVGVVQEAATWWYLCPERGRCDFSRLDAAVRGARERGLGVTLQVTGVPDWVHPDLASRPEWERHWTPPRNAAERAALTTFTAELATRYRGQVQRYEIWNEPNLPGFNHPHPAPEVAAGTIAAGYTGVKQADPGALVVTGGLSRADVGFAERMIEELNKIPGAAAANGFFDELGVHPYSDADSPLAQLPDKVHRSRFGVWDHNFGGFETILRMLDRKGRPGTKVWLGELGYSTTRTWMRAVPDERRALYLMLAADLVRHHPRVSGLVWYGYLPHSATAASWAIMTADGRPSLTFQALAAANRGQTALRLPPQAPSGCPPVPAGADGTGGPAPAGASGRDGNTLTGPVTGAVTGSGSGRALDGAADSVDRVTGLVTGAVTGAVTWAPRCVGLTTAASEIHRWEVYLDGVVVASGDGATARWDSSSVPDGTRRLTLAFYRSGQPPHYTPAMLLAVRNSHGQSQSAR